MKTGTKIKIEYNNSYQMVLEKILFVIDKGSWVTKPLRIINAFRFWTIESREVLMKRNITGSFRADYWDGGY